MPRKKRDWYPGATYHVMCRGIRRMAIFREEEDYEMFLLMVKKTMECLPFTLHSYCMMTNHIHLQITTMDSEIWKIMKRLLSSYARNFNNKYVSKMQFIFWKWAGIFILMRSEREWWGSQWHIHCWIVWCIVCDRFRKEQWNKNNSRSSWEIW